MKGSLLELRLPAAVDGGGQAEGDTVKNYAKILPRENTVKRDAGNNCFLIHHSPPEQIQCSLSETLLEG